jgi:multidrug efflux pump subunit AcrA (membrane-fusion protein)
VVSPQILLETQNQHKQAAAAWKASQAAVTKAKSQLLAARATLKENKVAVDVARDRVAVAESEAKRLEAWVGYLTLTAPFDGVISARNANSMDFVLPRTGDPSADQRAPYLAPGGQAAPIFVVDRTDVVRIFVDVPEADANYVKEGTKASVLVRAFRDQWIPAAVTRTSWALNVKSRTLRAEIDLRNTEHPTPYEDPGQHPIVKVPTNNGAQILPNMYALGKVIIERPNVLSLPESALYYEDEKAFYWACEDGKAVKVQVQRGVSDGNWIEVTYREAPRASTGKDPWVPIDGSEKVILGDLSVLTQGAAVRVGEAAK